MFRFNWAGFEYSKVCLLTKCCDLVKWVFKCDLCFTSFLLIRDFGELCLIVYVQWIQFFK